MKLHPRTPPAPAKRQLKRPGDANPRAPSSEPISATFAQHWPLYCMEAAELALFMLSACVFDVLIFGPHSRVATWPGALRRALMGTSMGATAIAIILSPLGRRSGAQFNPAVSITFYRLGKLPPKDTLFYVLFQFLGGAVGVGIAALVLGRALAAPQVDYVVTVPGEGASGQPLPLRSSWPLC